MEKFNFRAKFFSAYGLDKEKNFLEAPRCGCVDDNGKDEGMLLVVESEDELHDFMIESVVRCSDARCAVFAHASNNDMFVVIKNMDAASFGRNPVHSYRAKEFNLEFFKIAASEYSLDSYALLVQELDGSWSVIEN